MSFFRGSLCVSAILFFSLTALAQSDLRVLKTTSDRAAANTDVTFNIQVANDGPEAASSATLTDTIPTGMTFVSISASPGGIFSPCTTPPVGSEGTITCTATPFAAGAVVNFTLVLHIPANTPPGTSFSNVATIGFTPDFEGVDPNGDNNTSAADVTPQGSDLAVTKTGPESAAADTNVTFNINVINFGPDAATGVTLTDAIPAGLTFVSLTATTGAGIFTEPCSTPAVGSGGTITCTAPTFAAGATVNFALVLHIPSETPPGTTFTNVATISFSEGFDPNDENNTSATSLTTSGASMADLLATKSAPGSAAPDSNVSFVIMIQNAGPTAAANVSFSDTLPGNMTFVSIMQNNGPTFDCSSQPAVGSGGTVTCTIASLPASASASFTLTAHIPPESGGTEYQNTVTVTSTTPDPNTENNTGVAGVIASAADVGITKTGPTTGTAGNQISWTLTLSNAGPDTAVDATFSDQLPSGTTFFSVVQNNGLEGVCNTPPQGTNGIVSCTTTLISGASAQFTLTATISSNVANGTVLSNTATATSASSDPNPENNSSTFQTTVETSANVSVTKTDSPDPVNAGSNLTYTITVGNGGPSDAASPQLSDLLPPGTTLVSFTVPAGWTRTDAVPVGGTGTVTATAPSLAAGSNAVFTLVVRVNSNAPGGDITNTATVTTTTPDPNSDNNSATATTTVVPQPDLTISKTHSGNFTAGQPGSYTITVTNVGGGATTGLVTVTDTVPNGLTPTGPSGLHNGWNCSINGQTVTCERFDVLAGGSSYPSITLTVQVINPAPLSVTNTATVSGGGDINPTNNSASDPTTINCSADPTLTNTNPLVISRFRQNGPGGPTDEFVEIYNPSAEEYVVATGNCTGGLSVVASAGNGTTSNAVLQVCHIPNGTVIPAGGYYLCTGATYSLNSLGLNSGQDAANAVGDTPIGCGGSCTGDIPNDAGLALLDVGANIVTLCQKGSFNCPSGFSFSNPQTGGSAGVYDSVGFNAYGPGAPIQGRPSLAGNFCEGPCLQPVGDASTAASCANPGGLFPVIAVAPACYGQAGQYELLRRQTTFDALRGTLHQDNNSNTDDFIFLAPNSAANMGLNLTGISGVTSVLGASVPQNSNAPTDMPRAQFTQAPFDTGSQLSARNAERNYTLDPTIANPVNNPLGTFILRLRFTNNSGLPISPIRFRVDNLSTLCGPQNASPAVATGDARNLSTAPGCGANGFTAILKLVNSTQETVVDSGGTSQFVYGTVMDDLSVGEPAAPGPLSPLGGGVDNTVTLNPSANSATVGDGVTGGTGQYNSVSFSSAPANVLRLRIKFGVVKSGRFILLLTPQAKFGSAPLEGINSTEKTGR